MRVVLITQDDPFFLATNIDFLLAKLPKYFGGGRCVLTSPSPFGRRESFVAKGFKHFESSARLFFTLHPQFLAAKLSPRRRVRSILMRHNIPLLEFDKSINADSSLNRIKALKPDVLISIAGNEIFRAP